MTTLLKNGRVVTAADEFDADVLIDGETIRAVGRGLGSADRVIDCAGKLVVPGGIDPHVHMELPFGGTVSSDDFETGTRAAAFGGTTTVIDFAIQYAGKSLAQTLDDWHAKARGRCAVDYGFHLGITRFETDQDKRELFDATQAGVTSFKVFLAYPGVFMVDDATLYRVMREASFYDAVTMVHAESGALIEELIRQHVADSEDMGPAGHMMTRPVLTEADGVERALRVAEYANARAFIVHVSSLEGADAIRRARRRGVKARGETCTQYLFLNGDKYFLPGFESAKYVFTPPLRHEDDMHRLWGRLGDGTLSEVSTDHCPFNFATQKTLGAGDFRKIPNGGPGVEDRLAMVHYGACVERNFTRSQWVNWTSTASARLFGLYPRKGTVAPGADADLVVFDPAARQVRSAATHHQRCDYNLYEGMEITGKVDKTFLRGKLVVDGADYLGSLGDGQYLARGVPDFG